MNFSDVMSKEMELRGNDRYISVEEPGQFGMQRGVSEFRDEADGTITAVASSKTFPMPCKDLDKPSNYNRYGELYGEIDGGKRFPITGIDVNKGSIILTSD